MYFNTDLNHFLNHKNILFLKHQVFKNTPVIQVNALQAIPTHSSGYANTQLRGASLKEGHTLPAAGNCSQKGLQ